ncbi:sodium ion-translocating decarboxylase subunit beta [Treponema primitia]|uniref:sodium ion-translocating decarboxylase subunit beta n=1 Tax=Treponema primitia TaxID=88058 RepID=UPI00191C4A00
MLGFDLHDATAIGIIGSADGPVAILISQILKSQYIGAIAVAAYLYMALEEDPGNFYCKRHYYSYGTSAFKTYKE